MKKLILFLLLAGIAVSCDLNRFDDQIAGSETLNQSITPEKRQTDVSAEKELLPAETTGEINKKKIIKDGRIGLIVDDLGYAKVVIDSLVKHFNGYYAGESFNNNEYVAFYNLTIRIPSDSFNEFILEIEKGWGEVIYKHVSARDVTEEFIDIETRLRNKKNYLEQYNELLRQAKNITEILEIQEKIRILEEEIESATGRLNFLNDQVDYSKIDLKISKRKELGYRQAERDEFFKRLKRSISNGWFGFVDFFLFLIKIWPFWIILAIIIYTWRRVKKYRKVNK